MRLKQVGGWGTEGEKPGAGTTQIGFSFRSHGLYSSFEVLCVCEPSWVSQCNYSVVMEHICWLPLESHSSRLSHAA